MSNAPLFASVETPEAAVDPRVKRTRQLLRQALVALLGEKGFETISVQDIAERATVNRVTFYDHYDDKFALLDDLIGEGFRELLRSRMEELSGPCRHACLKALLLALCDYLGKLIGHCKIHHQPLFEPLVESRVKALLCGRIAEWLETEPAGRLRNEPKLGATLAGWSLYGAVLEWSKAPASRRQPAEAFAAALLPSIEAALYKD